MSPFGVSAKDGASSVGVFAPLINTETNNYQGKIHLAAKGEEKIFCGSKKELFLINEADIDWVTQADPEQQLCQKCKKAAINHLNNKRTVKQDSNWSAFEWVEHSK